MAGAGVLGRDDELARVDDVVAGRGPAALLVLGDAGTGKTTLLTHAVERARAEGQAVLVARGTAHEQDADHAALHRLLRPALDGVDALPGAQAAALRAAFGLAVTSPDPAVPDSAVPDPLRLAIGVLTLLSDLARDDRRVLAVVDDLHWVDPASARVLDFVATRLDGEPVALLLGSRPTGRDTRHLTTLHLGPLEPGAAAALVDAQPTPPRGERRRRVLRHAEGNPLALVELARADARLPVDDAAPAPLTARLERAFTDRTQTLPPATRDLLLLAAAAGAADLSAVLAAHTRLEDWEPAERAGLVRLTAAGGGAPAVEFRHPLVRSAVYGAATLARRTAAHRELAQLVRHDADRHAWHVAAAAVGPDEEAAALLDATAERARLRGGWSSAGRALERAAGLTPDPDVAVERLLHAGWCALYAGQGPWVLELMERARALASPARRAAVDGLTGWALTGTPRHAEAVTLLLGTLAPPTPTSAAGPGGPGAPPDGRGDSEHDSGHDSAHGGAHGGGPDGAADPDPAHASGAPGAAGTADAAGAAIAPAAVAAYLSGDPALTARVREALAGWDPSDHPQLLWARAACDPTAHATVTSAAIDRLLDAVDGNPDGLDHIALNGLSGAAWVIDDTARACDLMAAYLRKLDGPDHEGVNALVLDTYGAALLEAGRWDEAWARLEEARRVASATGNETVGLASQGALAHLAALRGEPEARDLAAAALVGIDPDATRVVGVRARWALGVAAASEGDWERAHQVLRLVLDDGAPAHPHLSLYALVDLVTCALRTGRNAEARAAAHTLRDAVGPGSSPRLHLLAAHAQALVAADDDAAEALFASALTQPRGGEWPFERARALADRGAWLRRRRRVVEAREDLSRAAETFARLGARPYAAWAVGELRAAGVRAAGAPDRGGVPGLATLSAQQRQIVLLAAAGLTNRQIGERLFLSPRTVGFHLYQVFPRLGVTSRAQLRDVVGDARPVI
ncbi:helix-turn-helix transcriptional regulator [Xylanimonas ulmi]|uniref:Regulatory LuxR family protein n=1 Tax=Xylanimonas ulmi TaxID=228973 RepID=A0A4Q7M4W5_9MICO|nr:LuxR family transcriptional regulator [Xylanibacterium ulmi]RZS62996.1 regulatory LuxR family protein [Xylanibacterium ulmi]